VYGDDSPVPLAMSPLVLREEEWHGRLPLPRHDGARSLHVDVFSEGMESPPRTGVAGRVAHLERVSVRLLVSLRRAWAARDTAVLRSVAESMVDTAAVLDSVTGARDPLAVRLTALAAAVTGPDRSRLRHPAWSLTLAELLDQRKDVLGPRYRAAY
jgi:hypothetical protein